jgi:PTS system mannose-specific IIC component
MTPLVTVMPFAMLGAVLGLDVVSFPQAMISRPIVASTLAGALAGSATAGLLMGITLELLAMETLPVGASRYPEWGSAAVVGGTAFASQPTPTAAAFAIAVLGALVTAWAGGWSMHVLRKANGAWARRVQGAIDAGDERTVNGLQLRGLTADLVRGGLLTGVSLAVLHLVEAPLAERWRLSDAWTVGIIATSAAVVAASATWKLSRGVSKAHWLFLGGALVGSVLVLVLSR